MEEILNQMLPHERLDIYQLYLRTTSRCSDIESPAVGQRVVFGHLERATESIGINLIRGNSQPAGSPTRANYLDIAIGSAHECASCLDICLAQYVITKEVHESITDDFWRIRGMLLGMKRIRQSSFKETQSPYGKPGFPFAQLEMYRLSLEFIRWIYDFLAESKIASRIQHRLDKSSTGTALNIAEGHGRTSTADQNRFMKVAQDHAYQGILLLDLIAARDSNLAIQSAEGKSLQSRIIAMLNAWRESNTTRVDDSGRRKE